MKNIPLHALVLLVGPSGAGKSTFAESVFERSEIVSSDAIRAELLGDFRNQNYQDKVWEELGRRVELKLSMGQRTVVDATNVRFRDRKPLIDIAAKYGVELFYIVLNRPIEEKLSTGGWRLTAGNLIERNDETYQNNLKGIMQGDGVATVIAIDNDVNWRDQVNTHKRVGHSSNMKDYPFEVCVIGDVHGNIDELKQVITAAQVVGDHRSVIFLGDIIDYGDHNLECFDVMFDMINNANAILILGNHERKMSKWIDSDFGRTFKGTISHGMQKTIDEINTKVAADPTFETKFISKWRAMQAASVQHIVIRDHLFTHGAATPTMWDKAGHSSLYGHDSNMAYFGEVDKTKPQRDDGYPNRTYNWINDVPAGKTVVVGHDVRSTTEPLVVSNSVGGKVIFLDTGSSKGGHLSYCIIN
jgi:protein phosphatase